MDAALAPIGWLAASALPLLLGSCAPRDERARAPSTPEPTPLASEPAPMAPAPATAIAPLGLKPDIGRFNEQVKRQLRDRMAWHRRVLEAPDLTDDRRAAAHGELANLYHAYQLFDAAEPLYLEAERLAPEELRWPYYLGLLYRSRNQLERSEASLARAVEIDPRFVPALVRLGEVSSDLDRPDRATERLRAAIAIDPGCAAAYFQLGVLAHAAGDATAAVDLLTRARELQPAATAIRRPLGLALRDAGRVDEARRELEAAGDVTVSLADPLMLALHRMSVSYWEKLAEGSRLLRATELEPARRALEEAMRDDPLAAPPRVLLADLFGQGSPVEARRQLELAVFLSETNPEAHRRLGRLWAAKGDFERAVAAFGAAVDEDPGDGPTLFDLAQAQRRAGRPVEALASARRAADVLTDHPMPLLYEATLEVELGRCADAAARLEQGLAASPRQGVWAHALARVLAACPDPAARDGQRALELARSLYAARATPGHAGAVAQALAETGDLAGALRWQEQAIASARELGRADLEAALERDRARFAAGEPSREPWRGEDLALFAAGAPSFR
jgi:tetratricopeptide (TPR) repeat protein